MFSHPTLLAFAWWFIPGAAMFAVAVSAILLAQCEIYPELWRGVGEARRIGWRLDREGEPYAANFRFT
jgi:hypothetical protein